MAESIRIFGLDELDRAFQQMRKEVLKELRPQLRQAGEIVRAEGQSLFSRIDVGSAAGYKVRVRQRGVAVEQSLPRVTGLRGDYGALQMNIALLPALQSKEAEVVSKIEQMIEDAASDAGLT
jgi:hypothetical protein